jgi:glycerophosphoryl diester phosphodiesterase
MTNVKMRHLESLRRIFPIPTVWLLVVLSLGLRSSLFAADAATPFHIQAHRGAGIARPENTLETFVTSWEMGVTPEADLRTTRDGEIVCFHDPDFGRVVSNVDEGTKLQGIEDLDWSKVHELEVGSFRGEQYAGQCVPLIADVFAKMRGKRDRLLYLDVKSVDLDGLAKLVRDAGVERQIVFTSEKYPLLRKWKEKVPESHTLLWNRGTEQQLDAKFAMLRADDFAGITHLQIHVRVGDLQSDDPFTPSSAYLRRVGDELTDRGIVFQVLPWECSDVRAYVRLLEVGAASFATDYPEVTLEAVEQYQSTAQRPSRD